MLQIRDLRATVSAMSLLRAAGLPVAAVMLAPGQAAAQDAQADAAAATADVAVPADGGMEDIIVTARRREERLQDVPVAITAIGPKALERANAGNVIAIAQLVPSMVVGRQIGGSGASIFLRGVGSSSLSSGFEQSVSTVLDGLPMSRGKEVIFSQFDLRQVEVLKGPQALFFGKNSTGGIINITTADPTDRFEASVKAGYEFEAREMFGEAVVSGPISDTVKARLAFRGSTQQGPFVNTGGPGFDSYGYFRAPVSKRRGANNSVAGRLTLLWDPTTNLNFRLKMGGTIYKEPNGADLYERKCGQGRTVPLTSGGVADPYADCNIDGRSDQSNIPQELVGAAPYVTSHPYTDSISYYINLGTNLDLGSFAVNSITGYYKFRQNDVASYNGSTYGNYVGQQYWFHQLSEEIRVASQFDGPFNFTVGGFYADYTHSFYGNNINGTLAKDPATGKPFVDPNNLYNTFGRRGTTDGKSASVFVSGQLKLSDALEISGGVRYSHDKKDTVHASAPNNTRSRTGSPFPKVVLDTFRDNNVSPEATITWKPSQELTLYGAYKMGYKAGGYNTSASLGPTAKASDGHFNSEKARGGEIGVRGRFGGGNLSVNLTAYNYRYTGLQVTIFDPVTVSSRSGNAGALTTRGVEGEFIWTVPQANGLEFHASAAYNDAKFNDYIGLCYTGQTIAEGCAFNKNAAGAFTSQDYSGRQAPKAPKFAGRIGGSLPVDLSDAWRVTLSTDVSYSSSYNYTDSLRPDAVQEAFARWDAGLRFENRDQGLEIGIYGRNLTNKYVITTANDFSFNDGVGGTGTAVGKRSDINAIVDRPRQIMVQLTKRF